MKINEIFLSIQGESTYQGRPCFFIRLSGCNLRCSYCDTEYAFYDGKKMDSDDIFTLVENSGVKLVEITGGEPLLQPVVTPFIKRLCDAGYEVLVETSGNADIDAADERAVRVMDIKCPSSGEEKKNDWRNLDKLTSNDEVKFVIGSREDYDYAVKILNRTGLEKKLTVLMSPLQKVSNHISKNQVSGKPLSKPRIIKGLEPKLLAEWILADKLNVRMQTQFHKQIWGDKPGV